MKKAKWLSMSVLLWLLLASTSASAGCFLFICWLDTEGTGPSWSCGNDALMNHHFNTKEHSYSFKSVCAVTIGDSASGFEINTTGTWKSDGTTTQRSVATNPAFTATVTASCKKDPWLYSTSCTGKKVMRTVPSSGEPGEMRSIYEDQLDAYEADPFPLTSTRLTDTQKSDFRIESRKLVRLKPFNVLLPKKSEQ